MTSNIGSQHLLEGVTEGGQITTDARAAVNRELRAHFRPEFLNRVDDVVMFSPLLLEEIGRIVELQLDQIRSRLADRSITIEATEDARRFIAESAYDPVYGARPLKRYLQREVETRIGRAIIGGEVTDGSRVELDVKDGELTVRVAKGERVGAT